MVSAPALRRGGWEFVGRDRELAELVASLEDALAGEGRLFLIAGEPGIGKTRLAEQLGRLATERGASVVWGRCWEGGGAPPFWPWAQIVRTIAEEADDQALTSWLGSGAAYVAQIAPDLAFRLGPAASALGSNGPSVESDAVRFCMFEAAGRFLKRAAGGTPLVLILDDLHAADDPSLLLLRYLARDLHGANLLIVGTYRDVEAGRLPGVGDALGELVRDGQLTTLRGLAQDDVLTLVQDLANGAASEGALRAVHQTTEGNPLFVREAVRLLASSGTLAQSGRPGVPIPSSVRALIQQRLAPLSAGAVQVLSAASVVGRDFDLALVQPACELPTERVQGAVSEAMSLGVAIDDAAAPGRYRFSHSLMREVIYEGLPIPVRASLHRAVGEAIERLYGPDADGHITELARHFSEVASVGEAARALTYTRRAGDRAMQTHAYEEAVIEYQRALRALELTGPDEGDRCELLLRLGAAQVRAGRYPDAKETHLQAVEIARRHGSTDALARAALGFGQPHVEGGHVNRQLVILLREALDALSPDDSPLRARLLARLSVELTFSDEAHLIDPLSQQAVEMARRLGDVRTLGDALDARWMAVWGPDGLEERTALSDEIVRLAQETEDRDLELLGRASRATTALEVGDFLAVEADLAAHARISDELRMPVHQWMTTTMRAMRALLSGAFAEAEALTEEGLALQPERPSARWAHQLELTQLRWDQGRLIELHERWRIQVERYPRLAIARAWLALADVERGDLDAARRALQLLAEQIPSRPRTGIWLPGLVSAALVAAGLDERGEGMDVDDGIAQAAAALYAALLPYAGQVVAMTMEQPVVCFGAAAFYLGLLATAVGRWDAAGEHFEAALRLHERLDAAPLLARTRYEYARMLLRRGQTTDRARARDLLDRAASAAGRLDLLGLRARIERLQSAPVPLLPAASGVPATEPRAATDTGAASPSMNPATDVASPTEAAEGVDVPVLAAGDQAAVDRRVSNQTASDRFQREGELWTISFDGRLVRMKDSKGLRQIALLLAKPGQELHATDLEALVGGPAEPAAATSVGRVGFGELELRTDSGDAGSLLDAEAKAAYKVRLDELQEEIEEAEDFNDPVRAERAREEREFLIRELARAVGLGGRDRKASSHAERARLNATRAIRSAMTHLTREHPSLGKHLAATIRTGRYCSYTPDPRSPVAWQL